MSSPHLLPRPAASASASASTSTSTSTNPSEKQTQTTDTTPTASSSMPGLGGTGTKPRSSGEPSSPGLLGLVPGPIPAPAPAKPNVSQTAQPRPNGTNTTSNTTSAPPAAAAAAAAPPFLQRILLSHHPPPLPLPSSPNAVLGPGTSLGSGSAAGAGAVPPPKAAPQPLYLPPPAIMDVQDDLVPPENFALVCPGVYRSGFPKKRNFGFMETLGLRTILTLVLEDYPEANLKWCEAQGVQFMQFGIPGNKEPFDNIPEDVIGSALCAILDRRNHPLLIHCNKGKHRTGCLVGCIRRTQSWTFTSIFDEYRQFSSPKSRAVDQQFIDLFDLDPVWDEMLRGAGLANLPTWTMLCVPRWVRKSPAPSAALPASPTSSPGQSAIAQEPETDKAENDSHTSTTSGIGITLPDGPTNPTPAPAPPPLARPLL